MIRLFCRFDDIVKNMLCENLLNDLLRNYWIFPRVPLDTKQIVVKS